MIFTDVIPSPATVILSEAKDDGYCYKIKQAVGWAEKPSMLSSSQIFEYSNKSGLLGFAAQPTF